LHQRISGERVSTLPARASMRRSASVGVPRSIPHPKVRSTLASRSARSSATRSIKNMERPSTCARRKRMRSKSRSIITGFEAIIAFCHGLATFQNRTAPAFTTGAPER
jgi:hypothetical protein